MQRVREVIILFQVFLLEFSFLLLNDLNGLFIHLLHFNPDLLSFQDKYPTFQISLSVTFCSSYAYFFYIFAARLIIQMETQKKSAVLHYAILHINKIKI